MKLYGSFTSPFVRHCRMALLEEGKEFEFIETDTVRSAEQSPTQRVPFLEDGSYFFTDSSAIIKYVRQQAGGEFCKSAKEMDEFCMATTALETTVNLFFIKRDGVNITEIPYLQRQAARIETTLAELNRLALPFSAPYNDAQLRLMCFMGWAKFRNLVDFSQYPQLEAFYNGALSYPPFITTAPNQ